MMPPSVLPSEEEQDDDTEYNFSTDKQMEEKEEFRNDRAVMISRKSSRLFKNLYFCEFFRKGGR